MSKTDVNDSTLKLYRKMKQWDGLFKLGVGLGLVLLGMVAFGGFIAPYSPSQIDPTAILAPPSSNHWLGTDRLGRDVFSRVMVGFRSSISVAIVSIMISATFGIVIGVSAAYRGGVLDTIVQRIVDALLTLPAFIGGLMIAAVTGGGFIGVILAISIRYTANLARYSRSVTLEKKDMSYIEAAYSYGCGDIRLIFVHLMPNIVSPLIVQIALLAGIAMIIEAGLSFVGLGIQPPTPSWGNMIRSGIETLRIAPWCAVFPGLALHITVLIFHILADGLRNQFDPKRKSARIQE